EKKRLTDVWLALEDFAFRQTELALEIERREHLPVKDAVLETRCVLGDGVHNNISERVAAIVPGARLQVERRVLDEAGHDMLSGGRHGWIGQTWNHDVDVR